MELCVRLKSAVVNRDILFILTFYYIQTSAAALVATAFAKMLDWNVAEGPRNNLFWDEFRFSAKEEFGGGRKRRGARDLPSAHRKTCLV